VVSRVRDALLRHFGVLAVTVCSIRHGRFVLFLMIAAYLVIGARLHGGGGLEAARSTSSSAGAWWPCLSVVLALFIYLGFLFMLGAVFELYRERIAVHDALGVGSGLIFWLRWRSAVLRIRPSRSLTCDLAVVRCRVSALGGPQERLFVWHLYLWFRWPTGFASFGSTGGATCICRDMGGRHLSWHQVVGMPPVKVAPRCILHARAATTIAQDGDTRISRQMAGSPTG